MTTIKKYVCPYCEAKLSSQGSLLNHKRRNKKCLNKQVQLGVIEKEEKKKINCNYCNKEYETQSEYDNHIVKCKINTSKHKEEVNKLHDQHKEEVNKLHDQYKTEINSLKSIISKYEGQIEGMSKGTVVNNNTTNNNTYTSNNNKTFNQANLNTIIGEGIDFSDKKRFADIINNQYTIKEFNGGVEKTAEFIVSKLLVDKNDKIQYMSKYNDRNEFYYRNKNNEIVKDDRNETLFDAVETPLIKKCNKIRNEQKFKNEFEDHDDSDGNVEKVNEIEFKITKLVKEIKKLKENKKEKKTEKKEEKSKKGKSERKKDKVDEEDNEDDDEGELELKENELKFLLKEKKNFERELSDDCKEVLEQNKIIDNKYNKIKKGFENSSKMGHAIRKVNHIKLDKIIKNNRANREKNGKEEKSGEKN